MDSKDWLDGSRGFCSIECSVHLEQLVCETKRDVFNKDGAQNIMQIHSAMEREEELKLPYILWMRQALSSIPGDTLKSKGLTQDEYNGSDG
ncbi:19443_t:CDS:2 [Entrophospora sp. SA101]|nr:19443_t:CDS:2 [Entrophospora sp. SA101]